MTEKKEVRGFSNFGFSTILLSFVMICVVTFSALSLISAYSDYKLSRKVADKNTSYYEAQEQAHEKLTAIEQILAESYLVSADENNYYSNTEKAIAEYGIFFATSSGYILHFKEPISENNYLSVKLSIHYPKVNADTFYEILEWKSVYEREFSVDESLDLID